MVTQAGIFKKANELIKEGYPRKQAFKIAYEELGEPKRKTARKPAAKKTTRKPRRNPASVNIDVDVSSHNAKGRKSGTSVKSNPRRNPVEPNLVSRPRKAANTKRIYTVEMKHGEVWKIEGIFPTAASAKEYAYALDEKHGHAKHIRVTV